VSPAQHVACVAMAVAMTLADPVGLPYLWRRGRSLSPVDDMGILPW
jgi:hypothetical protein